jgi:hypothetical protein
LDGIAATCWQYRQQLRRAGRDVLEQAVDRRESLVAGADVVAAVLFEVAKESEDPLEGEIIELKARELAAPVRGDEQQKQPDRVSVAAHRPGTQALDRDQVVDEVGVQELPERRGGAHRSISIHAGSANRSKRWLAS